MRKIEEKMVAAIRQALASTDDYQAFPVGDNTIVRHHGDHVLVELHGHAIVRFEAGGAVSVNLRNWDTRTTRSRMNAALSAFVPGARVYRHRGTPYLHRANGDKVAMDESGYHHAGRRPGFTVYPAGDGLPAHAVLHRT